MMMSFDQSILSFAKDIACNIDTWGVYTVASAFTAATVGYFSGKKLGIFQSTARYVESYIEVMEEPVTPSTVWESLLGLDHFVVGLTALVAVNFLTAAYVVVFKLPDLTGKYFIASERANRLVVQGANLEKDMDKLWGTVEIDLPGLKQQFSEAQHKFFAKAAKLTKRSQQEIHNAGTKTAEKCRRACETLKPLLLEAESYKTMLVQDGQLIRDELESAKQTIGELTSTLRHAREEYDEKCTEVRGRIDAFDSYFSDTKRELQAQFAKVGLDMSRSHAMLVETRRLVEKEDTAEPIKELFWPLDQPLLQLDNDTPDSSVLKDSTDLILVQTYNRMAKFESKLAELAQGRVEMEIELKRDLVVDVRDNVEELKTQLSGNRAELDTMWRSWVATVLGITLSFYIDSRTGGGLSSLERFRTGVVKTCRAELREQESELLLVLQSLSSSVNDAINDCVVLLLQFYLFKLSRSDVQNSSTIVSSVLGDCASNLSNNIERLLKQTEFQICELLRPAKTFQAIEQKLAKSVRLLREELTEECVSRIENLHDLLHVNIQGSGIIVNAIAEEEHENEPSETSFDSVSREDSSDSDSAELRPFRLGSY